MAAKVVEPLFGPCSNFLIVTCVDLGQGTGWHWSVGAGRSGTLAQVLQSSTKMEFTAFFIVKYNH